MGIVIQVIVNFVKVNCVNSDENVVGVMLKIVDLVGIKAILIYCPMY